MPTAFSIAGVNLGEAFDDDQRLRPTDRAQQHRRHRHHGHAGRIPATEHDHDAADREDGARQPFPAETLLTLHERESEREQRHGGDQHLSKPSGRSNESPIEEREPAAELQRAIEDGAKKRAAAGDIGV
jgi:hypothetical protein